MVKTAIELELPRERVYGPPPVRGREPGKIATAQTLKIEPILEDATERIHIPLGFEGRKRPLPAECGVLIDGASV
jgi:hypothetical protein